MQRIYHATTHYVTHHIPCAVSVLASSSIPIGALVLNTFNSYVRMTVHL
jgi:hypothetical protein